MGQNWCTYIDSSTHCQRFHPAAGAQRSCRGILIQHQMVNYNAYCDESNLKSHFMVIGGVWVPWQQEELLRRKITDLRETTGLLGEFRWKKTSKAKIGEYRGFVDTFFSISALRFNCIVVNNYIFDPKAFHEGDWELGFYKLYYLVITRNLNSLGRYWFYLDDRNNRKKNRLGVLKSISNNWCKAHLKCEPIRQIEPRISHSDDLIQLADVLCGAVGYMWNDRSESPAKLELAHYIARRAGLQTLRINTHPESRFNIWQWRPNTK